MIFIILGRVKPYTRMTRRGKFGSPSAQGYLASQNAVTWQIKDQMIQNDWIMLPERTPLKVAIEFTIPKGLHRCDLDNLAKAVIDAAQGLAFRNDLWIDRLRVRRTLGREWKTILKVNIDESTEIN